MEVDDGHLEESDLFDLYEAMHVPLPETRFSDNSGDEPAAEPSLPSPTDTTVTQPFRRWMSTLRRRHLERRKGRHTETPRLSFDLDNGNTDGATQSNHLQESMRRNSESMSSSIGYVGTMKTASMTVGSTSIAPRSDAGYPGRSRIGRSSHYSDARRSMDSHRGPLGPIVDESAWLRSLQRRKIVEELVASEEGYIADLKVLINVCDSDRYALKPLS
jgi:hypothetical protein